jgi:hypothetical protein
MKKGFREVLANGRQVGDRFAYFDARISQALEPISEELQRFLVVLSGRSFDTLEENQLIARLLTALLNRLGKRLRCTKEGCERPGILTCQTGPRRQKGVFQFRHSFKGRITHHRAYTALPPLQLIEAPPDRRRKGAT